MGQSRWPLGCGIFFFALGIIFAVAGPFIWIYAGKLAVENTLNDRLRERAVVTSNVCVFFFFFLEPFVFFFFVSIIIKFFFLD
jgi:hypothetical protein